MALEILIVEDEPAIAESVQYALSRDGFEATIATTFADGWQARRSASLIVLDLMLPDGSGLDLIRNMRAERDATPIIVLSSRDAETDRVVALESGADDYVTKPFSPREVVARVRAVLRRYSGPSDHQGTEPSLSTDLDTRRARAGATVLDLTRVEFDLLTELLSRPGHVFTRAGLIDGIWGKGYAITDRTIDSHVKSLRRKIADAGADAALIETVRGVGYRIAAETRADPP